MSSTDVKFWHCDRNEQKLSWTTIDEAVGAWLDRLDRDARPIPATVTVYGWKTMELPTAERLAGYILDDVLEGIANSWDMAREDSVEVTPKMREAAIAFATVLRNEYEMYSCEYVTERVVNVRDYVQSDAASVSPEDSKNGQ